MLICIQIERTFMYASPFLSSSYLLSRFEIAIIPKMRDRNIDRKRNSEREKNININRLLDERMYVCMYVHMYVCMYKSRTFGLNKIYLLYIKN